MIGLVRVGREEVVLWTGGAEGSDGRFVGWLDVDLTTRARSCAAAGAVEMPAVTAAHTESKNNFLKFIYGFFLSVFAYFRKIVRNEDGKKKNLPIKRKPLMRAFSQDLLFSFTAIR